MGSEAAADHGLKMQFGCCHPKLWGISTYNTGEFLHRAVPSVQDAPYGPCISPAETLVLWMCGRLTGLEATCFKLLSMVTM
jgi:hypothetical protein